MATSQTPSELYAAFLTTEGADGPRVPVGTAERIVVVLGQDDDSGFPLELSICLRRDDDQSVFIYAIKEPTLPLTHFPDLIVEEVSAHNVRRITVRMKRIIGSDA